MAEGGWRVACRGHRHSASAVNVHVKVKANAWLATSHRLAEGMRKPAGNPRLEKGHGWWPSWVNAAPSFISHV